MTREIDALVDAFDDLLDRERALLLGGGLDGLARITEAKADLVARLGAGAPVAGLERLKGKALRNAHLLEAAGAGVRTVARRIAAARSGPEPLSTYSADGRRQTIGGSAGAVERRA